MRIRSRQRLILISMTLFLYMTFHWSINVAKDCINNYITKSLYHHSDCWERPLTLTSFQLTSEIWIPVLNSTDEVLVFSAFYTNATIVMMAIRDFGTNLSDFFCQFWRTDSESIEDDKRSSTVSTDMVICPESHGKRYSAAFFKCKVPNKNIPKAVSLVTGKCQKPTNVIPVIYNTEIQRNFTVCVAPLNFRYSKGYQLVEMIELNMVLGADHFVFYNYSTDWNVDEILKYYQKMGLVTVIQWHLPMKVDTWPIKKGPVEIHYFGQLAMLNDCLHRNRGLSKYVVFQDLDEFIIPRQHNSWHDMMRSLPSNMASYMFRCTFFRLEWPNIEDTSEMYDTAREHKAFTFLKQQREEKIFGKTLRAKYIVDPKLVETVGIHNIWRLKSGHKPYFVSPDIALLHHYRSWNDPADKGKRIYDNRIINYKIALYNIEQTWENIKHIPMGPL